VLQSKKHNYRANDQKINIYDAAIVGPFNFGHPAKYSNRSKVIPDEVWDALTTKAAPYTKSTSPISTSLPPSQLKKKKKNIKEKEKAIH